MKVLIYGDSMAKSFSSLASLLGKDCDVHIESFPGATGEELLHFPFGIPFLLEEDKYDTVVLVVGHNDLEFTPREGKKIIEGMIKQCQGLRVIVASTMALLPLSGAEKLALPKEFLLQKYYSDDVHFNEEGGKLWSNTLSSFLQKKENSE